MFMARSLSLHIQLDFNIEEDEKTTDEFDFATFEEQLEAEIAHKMTDEYLTNDCSEF